MRVLGAIIAGGASRRMGQAKALMAWRGRTLIEHVAAALEPQADGLVVNANGDALAFLGLPIVADSRPTQTPLAGLHAVLAHAQAYGFDAVLTSPCDTPLLPGNLRARLQGAAPAIAVSHGQPHHLTGFWPAALLPRLAAAMDGGLIRLMDWGALCQARPVEWTGPDPFININTPEDFQRLSDLP